MVAHYKRIKIQVIFIILLSVCFRLSLYPQENVFDFVHLDNTNGLSNNQVDCIFKDSRGFMWFGTNYGINRYDGYNFKVYTANKTDTSGLPFNAAVNIQEDFDGNLWLENNRQYTVYEYRTEKFNRNIEPFLSRMQLKPDPDLIEIDTSKIFYAYYPDVGIYKYDSRSRKVDFFPQSDEINTLSRGRILFMKKYKDHLWVLFTSGLVERINEATHTIDFRSKYIADNFQGSTIIKNLFVDAEGCPWVYPGIKDRGALYYDFNAGKWIKLNSYQGDIIIQSDFVRDVAQDQSGLIWIATDHGGVNILNKQTGKITVLKNDPANSNSLGQNSAISLYCDNSGIVWVGTYKNGISYYHPQLFKFNKSPLFFLQSDDVELKDCNCLYEDSNKNLWIGTNGGGLIKYDKTTGKFNIYKHKENDPYSISADIVISMLEDSEGEMWFGTFLGGLNRLDGGKFVRYLPVENNPNSLSNKNVYGLIEDKNKNIWIGTLGGGVNKLDASRKNFQQFTTATDSGLWSDYILSSFTGNNEEIYLSTPTGISLIHANSNVITPYFSNREQLDQLADPIIYNVLIDRKKQMWIATNNGLNIYQPDKNTFLHLNQQSGLSSEQIVSLVEDNSGNIWAGTRNGLACIYSSENEEGNNYRIVSFDEKDGLPSAICNQNALFKSKSGEIYVGTTKGYTAFNPEEILFNQEVPKPLFTELLIYNQEITPGVEYKKRVILDRSISMGGELRLKSDEKNFTLHFSAMNYIHPEKSRYRHRLKGLETEWTETRNGGTVSYSNLSPGKYELEVFASNNDGIFTTEPISMKIIVEPPFWMTWWAYILYSLTILSLLWMILHFNFKKQKKKFDHEQRILEAKRMHDMDEMKFRFFTDVSHEFRTPLTLVINPIEKLYNEATEPEQKSLLSIARKNATGLLELVNQLLDFRKLDVNKVTMNVSAGDIVEFVKDICYSFADLANSKSIYLSFATSVPEFRMEFDKEKLRKIIANLLSNAFKYTFEKGKISVTISFAEGTNGNDRMLKISVEDTGIGIAEEHLDKIFDRFYRIENSEMSEQTGTGVGLHLSSEYAKLHHGEIKVESVLGKGSVFTLFIPVVAPVYREVISLSQPELEKEHKFMAESEELDTAGLSHKKSSPLLLIVDDHEDFRNFISTLFKNSFRVITANDGETAHALVLEKLPDLIISDVMMPKMDGFELCRLIKEDIRTSHIPVILLTAKASDESKYSGIEAGADDYISKPFNMEILKLKVSRLIERQQKIQEKFRNKIDISIGEADITSPDEEFMKKVIALVEKNMSNPDFLVEDLGKEMGMSRVYFYKKILSLTSKTPSEFIRFIRLNRAAKLLQKTQLFVNEVAFQVGFNNPKYFRKYFKDEFGETPNEYKKKFTGKCL